MSSSSSPTPPSPTPQQDLVPPRPSFMEYPIDQEAGPTRQRQSRGSISGTLRPQDRQGSSASIPNSGASTPNPFSTPILAATNPLSPPASVISFSLGDTTATGTGFNDVHRRISRISAHSSGVNSAVDLQNRQSVTPREPFSSPRPLTALYPSAGLRSRANKRKSRPMSTMLSGEITKPWLGKKDRSARISYILTYSVFVIGIIGSAVRCYFGWKNVQLIGKTCLVLDEDFSGSQLDTSIWTQEVDMGGFGNDEFEMATGSSNNSFIRNGQLYIVPTLTSDVIGKDAIFNGYTYNLTGCTNTNLTACGAVSNITTGTVINPVMSARITTKGKRNIQYGRVEVRAKLPRGDWIWPAIWMLPENNTYGPWPISGEIDIMESRGNGPAYSGQGLNVVRGSLNWGPLSWLNAVYKTYGWWSMRRSTYADGFHTYALEWTPDFLRIYVDSRLTYMLSLTFNIPFFERGKFPTSVANASQEIILPNPWAGRGNSAPFDQPFYLVLDVAVGGTSGWFPDGAGDKPWLNGAINAMQQFAQSQDKWYATWPESDDDRALRIDSVKMWELC